jgi:hypothetical protein
MDGDCFQLFAWRRTEADLGCRRHQKAINDAPKAAMSDIEVGPLERPAVRQNLSVQIARKCRSDRLVRRVQKLIEGDKLTTGLLTISASEAISRPDLPSEGRRSYQFTLIQNKLSGLSKLNASLLGRFASGAHTLPNRVPFKLSDVCENVHVHFSLVRDSVSPPLGNS